MCPQAGSSSKKFLCGALHLASAHVFFNVIKRCCLPGLNKAPFYSNERKTGLAVGSVNFSVLWRISWMILGSSFRVRCYSLELCWIMLHFVNAHGISRFNSIWALIFPLLTPWKSMGFHVATGRSASEVSFFWFLVFLFLFQFVNPTSHNSLIWCPSKCDATVIVSKQRLKT